MVDMVKQLPDAEAFEQFSTSLFRMTRALRSTANLWVQLPGSLKRSDVTILKVLADHGDSRPSAIAEHLDVGPSVISRQLVSLATDGLVVRRKDPDDGRAELISLSAEGEQRLRALREAYVRGMREQFAGWDTAQVLGAAELLDEIADHIAPMLGRRPAGAHPNHTDTEDPHE